MNVDVPLFSLFLKIFKFYFICMDIFPACLSVSCEYVKYSQEEGSRSLETGVRDVCETPYQVLEMKLGPLKEQPMYLTAEAPLQLSCLCLDHPLIILPLTLFIPVELYWTIPVVTSEGDKFFYNRKFLSPEKQAKGLWQYSLFLIYLVAKNTIFQVNLPRNFPHQFSKWSQNIFSMTPIDPFKNITI